MADQKDAEGQKKPDPELLAALDRKIASARSEQQKHESGGLQGQAMTPSAVRAARVGFELVLAMLFGLGVGWGLDRYFHMMPLFSLLFGFLGFGAGVMNAWRAVQGVYGEIGFRRDKTDKN